MCARNPVGRGQKLVGPRTGRPYCHCGLPTRLLLIRSVALLQRHTRRGRQCRTIEGGLFSRLDEEEPLYPPVLWPNCSSKRVSRSIWRGEELEFAFRFAVGVAHLLPIIFSKFLYTTKYEAWNIMYYYVLFETHLCNFAYWLLLTPLIRRYAACSLKCIPNLIKMSKNEFESIPSTSYSFKNRSYPRLLWKKIRKNSVTRSLTTFQRFVFFRETIWKYSYRAFLVAEDISDKMVANEGEKHEPDTRSPPPFKRRPRNSSDHLKPRLSEKIVILVSDRVLEWTADAINRFQRVWVRDR